MDIWSEAKDRYVAGGITQREISAEYNLPLGAVRRRASQEKWLQQRGEQAQKKRPGLSERIDRQLALADRLMSIIEKVLSDESELYGWIEFSKTGGGNDFIAKELKYVNDARLGRLVKLAADIIELQRRVLGIHEYRDELSAQKLTNDSELASRKLEQQTELANRKLEIELMKLESLQGEADVTDNFLAALGFGECDDGEEQEE